jgi:hypothetical protein
MKQPQFKVSMPDVLREWLEKASTDSGKSIAEEIRERVTRSFAIRVDPETSDLIDFIVRLALQMEQETGSPWHDQAGVNQVFASALSRRVRRFVREDGPTDFLVRGEPFQGKRIDSDVARDEFSRIIEWLDLREHPIPIKPPRIDRTTPTAEELLKPAAKRKEKS